MCSIHVLVIHMCISLNIFLNLMAREDGDDDDDKAGASGSVMECLLLSLNEPRFSSQHSPISSQLPITSSQGTPIPSSAF